MRHALSLILCLFLLSLPACDRAAADERFIDFVEVTSPGGITAWLAEDHALPVITIDFAFAGSGSAHDPEDKQGLSQLASNTLDEGAGDLESQEFQKTLNDNSIDLRFTNGRDNFGGIVKTLTYRRDIAFKLLRLALNEPRFDAEPVERMRQANITRIRSSLSDPDWITARIQNDVAFAGHPYAQNSGGTLTTLHNITPEDLHEFTRTRLTKDRLKITVAGDITEKQLKKMLDEVFGTLPAQSNLAPVADTTIKNGGEIVLYKKDIPQTIINIIQPGIDREHPDYYAYQVMNFILGGSGLGSRLNTEIREERGLSYGVSSYINNLDHVKAWAASTSTENKNVGEVLSLVRQEMTKIMDEPVTDTELADAKSYLIGSMPLSLVSTRNISSIGLDLQLEELPIDHLDTLDKKISAVTKEDIQRVAKEVLNPDNLTIVLTGQPKNIEPTQTTDKIPNAE